ncbi:50S ribosomal protein L32 [Balamuthia mandrillaris]
MNDRVSFSFYSPPTHTANRLQRDMSGAIPRFWSPLSTGLWARSFVLGSYESTPSFIIRWGCTASLFGAVLGSKLWLLNTPANPVPVYHQLEEEEISSARWETAESELLRQEHMVMAVPKKKVSVSRQRHRRGAYDKKLKNKHNIEFCYTCGRPKLRHHVCLTCSGFKLS